MAAELTQPIVVWFRQDLRLADHKALQAAIKTGRPIVALFVLDDVTPGDWKLGGASRWWLHGSLLTLSESFEALGGKLVLRRGSVTEVLPRVVEEVGAYGLYFNRHYEPYWQRAEQELFDELSESLEVRRFGGTLLWDPSQIQTGQGTPFRVFTPFWKNCLSQQAPTLPIAAPASATFAAPPASDDLADFQLLPTRPDWAGGLRAAWRPGEAAAHQALDDFVGDGIGDYKELRDRPDLAGTSRLSPYLHFGELSPRQIWHVVRDRTGGGEQPGASAFLREVGWREFCYHLLHHWPRIPNQPFRAEYETFPWAENEADLRAWQKGETGIPIVDAGMRQLWETGWMHNRVRMIAASLLTKNLLLPWQHGADWFWDTLVDADLANNSAGWQWVAGCGADAAPYFRIFNPVTQGERFDAAGDYVRRYVPELKRIPDRHLHAPWTASEPVLNDAGVVLGKDYPLPIVDLKQSRERALATYSAHKSNS